MVVGESLELILVFLTIVVMYVFMFSIERLTRHEGPPGGEPSSGAQSGAKE